MFPHTALKEKKPYKEKAKKLLERTIRYCQGYVEDGDLIIERHYEDNNPYIVIRVVLDNNRRLKLKKVMGYWGETPQEALKKALRPSAFK